MDGIFTDLFTEPVTSDAPRVESRTSALDPGDTASRQILPPVGAAQGNPSPSAAGAAAPPLASALAKRGSSAKPRGRR
eukprot:2000585-Prymnesium_polylepis.2